ncbi:MULTISPECIES: WXG100 family type VII secretion target [unclassified Streptomyces]|uniref:WXG100 family type VII secretion target n=1 Tax=unclassified Streptomyces TaxID=2593676 RepID=UPI002251B1DD|nr:MULTISPECIES: hypothetical protein [unclassified Streptomyces]MCX4829758.1 hypothetical protein [Streptomyces sp. NBC_01016]
MAGSGFDVDADVLKAQARSFDRLASDFASKSKDFKDKVDRLEKAWGDDDVELASPIIDVYKPVSAGIRDSLEHLGEALKDIGKNLDSVAEGYDQTEQEHHRALMQAAQQSRG